MPTSEFQTSLSERARRISALAELLVRRTRVLGWLALGSAVWLWLVLFVILGSIPHFLLALPAAVIGLILLPPGLVVLLTTLGLKSLTRLPQRIGAELAPKPDAAPQRRGPIGLLRKLWAIRREMLGYKLVLVRYAGAVRLFALPVLLIISLAVIACLFQLLLALLSLTLVLVSGVFFPS